MPSRAANISGLLLIKSTTLFGAQGSLLAEILDRDRLKATWPGLLRLKHGSTRAVQRLMQFFQQRTQLSKLFSVQSHPAAGINTFQPSSQVECWIAPDKTRGVGSVDGAFRWLQDAHQYFPEIREEFSCLWEIHSDKIASDSRKSRDSPRKSQ